MILDKIEKLIAAYRQWFVHRAPGPYGDWHREHGVDQFWRALPATPEDIAIDAGGHLGDWTAQLVCQYGCKALVFEPVGDYCAKIRQRFANNPRVKVFESGLAGSRRQEAFAVDGLASSVFPTKPIDKSITVQMVDVRDVFAEHDLTDVACMKMNIEGGEYELFERMIELDLVRRVRCYLIQFHTCAPDYDARHQRIRQELAKTHRMVFAYPHVWERWDRKPTAVA